MEERQRDRGEGGEVEADEGGEDTYEEVEERTEEETSGGGLKIEVGGTEGGTAVSLEAELGMEVKGRLDEGEGEGGWNLLLLGATGHLNQEAKTVCKALVDVCNGFNKLIRL